MFSPWIFWVIVGVVVAYIAVAVIMAMRKRGPYNRHIGPLVRISVRPDEKWVGVVLAKDHDKASRLYWKKKLSGEEPYYSNSDGWRNSDGQRIVVKTTFVFPNGCPEFRTLIRWCFVEQAEFWVEPNFDKPTIEAAWQYFHGQPFKGEVTMN